jgi:DNA end-binding protein Ku
MIEKKAAGEEIAIQPETEEAAPVPDLMSALKASLDAVRKSGGEGDGDAEAPKRGKRAASPGTKAGAKAKSTAKK